MSKFMKNLSERQVWEQIKEININNENEVKVPNKRWG